MKISFVISSLGAGGAEKVCATLANQLIKRKDYQISIICFFDILTLVNEIDPRIKIINLKANSLKNGIPKLCKALLNIKPDKILANIWPITIITIFCNYFNLKNRANIITIEHSFLTEDFRGKSKLFIILANFSIKLFYPLASHNVAVSMAAMGDLKKRLNRKIEVIYNPIKRPIIKDRRNIHKNTWQLSKCLKLVSVGTLKTQKNFELQIEACHFLSKMGFEYKHLIIGEGNQRHKLEKMIKDKNLSDKVFLEGFSKNPYQFLQIADIFLITSDYEAFGNVIVEALHCGLKIIARNDHSGAGEILGDGKYGFIFSGNNPENLSKRIIEVSKDNISREMLINRANDFNPEIICDQYEKLLQQ